MEQIPQINSIYISPRLASRLAEAEYGQVTTIVAPMGYGKSTAVRWWMDRWVQAHPETVILRQTLTIDSAEAPGDGHPPTDPDDRQRGGLLAGILPGPAEVP